MIKENYSGSIKEMLSIALPMVVSSGCETVMVFTDRLFLSRLGMEEMSASMAGGLSVFFMTAFLVGMMGYSTAMTAQYFGSGDKEKCPLVLTQALIIAFCFFPILLLLKNPMHAFFVKTGISEGQLEHQFVYFDILLYTSVLPLVRVVFSNFFSGIGKTRIVMFASIGAMLLNVLASYTLVFGNFGFAPMGIKGAAYGTVCGIIFAIVVLAVAYFMRSIRDEFRVMESFKVDFHVIKKMFRFGTPSGFELFMMIAAFNLMIAVFHSSGQVSAAAATIMFNWDYVSFIPLLGLEVGVTSLVGRYVGASRYDIAEKSVYSGLKIGWMFSIFVLISFMFFPGVLVDVFKPAQVDALYLEVRPVAVFMVRFASVYIMLNTVMIVYMGALKGAGDTFWSMMINSVSNWVFLAALYIAMKVLKMPPEQGWVVLILTFVSLPLILFLRFKSGKWKQIQVLG